MTATTSFASADLRPLHGADAISFELTPSRVALVAPRGLFRDSLAHVMARFVEDVHLECYDDVEDVVFGPASLGLIAFDPLLTDRGELRAKIAALRTRCGAPPWASWRPTSGGQRRPDSARSVSPASSPNRPALPSPSPRSV